MKKILVTLISLTLIGCSESKKPDPFNGAVTLTNSELTQATTSDRIDEAVYSKRSSFVMYGKTETNEVHKARVIATHYMQPIGIYMDTNEFLRVSFIDEKGNNRTFKSQSRMVEVKK